MARRLIKQRLIVASHNPGKVRELETLLGPFGFELVSAATLGLAEPEETGTTFAENSELKARAAVEASGLVALADDSGITVDALDGAPGIYSARWAGTDRDFLSAMQRVESELQALGATAPAARRASFVADLCLVWPDGGVEHFEGRVDGHLVWPPRGDKGFGYDPMFVPDGHDRTFGEMDADEKHGWSRGRQGLSHRARAFARLVELALDGS